MSSVFSNLFGGKDDSGQKAQAAANQGTLALQANLASGARDDALKILPIADENRNLGFQAALDAFGAGTEQQIGAFQGGNVGAQDALIAGLPQIQNAILGNPTDLSGFQPQTLQFDSSFLNQTLPQFKQSDPVLTAQGKLTNQGAAQLSGILAQSPQLAQIFTGDVSNDPADVNTQNVETMSIADLEAAIDQTTMVGLMPGMGLPAALSKAMLQAELEARSAFGADGQGNTSSDPSAPGGVGGSAGDAASTGSGGFGPDQGGDGGFGL